MKENKVAFITCVADKILYQKNLSYINKLQVPEGIEIEIIPIMDAKSITSAYNEVMHKSDSKYKVYLHEDVYIQNTEFIKLKKQERIILLNSELSTLFCKLLTCDL